MNQWRRPLVLIQFLRLQHRLQGILAKPPSGMLRLAFGSLDLGEVLQRELVGSNGSRLAQIHGAEGSNDAIVGFDPDREPELRIDEPGVSMRTGPLDAYSLPREGRSDRLTYLEIG